MLRKFGFLINYIILYAGCILISANYGEKEHIVITEYKNKINAIVESSGYVLDENNINTGVGGLVYVYGDKEIRYYFSHNYKEAHFKGLHVTVQMNFYDDIADTVDIINKLTPKQHSILYSDVVNAIEKYKLTNERQEINNREDFDKYGSYYILGITNSVKANKDYMLWYQIVSK